MEVTGKSYLKVAVNAAGKDAYGLRKILKLKFLLGLVQAVFYESLEKVMLDQEGKLYLYLYLVFLL